MLKPWRNLTETEIARAKKHCPNCKYASGRTHGSISKITCDYILIEGRRRGCRIEECTLWKTNKRPKTPAKKQAPIMHCSDHLGNKFRNMAEMCEAYGIAIGTFKDRKHAGWDLKSALTTPPKEAGRSTAITDHTGKEYPCIKEMCAAYGIPHSTYTNRRRAGWSVEDALTRPR